jgi:hypothetical protein
MFVWRRGVCHEKQVNHYKIAMYVIIIVDMILLKYDPHESG